MPPENISPEQLQVIVGQLTAATQTAAEGIKQLAEDAKEHDRAITQAITTLKKIDEMVGDLVQVIHKGNGSDSIMAQLAVAKSERKSLGRSVDGIKTTIDGLHTALDDEVDSRERADKKRLQAEIDDNKAENQTKTKNKTAIFCAVIAALAACAAAGLKIFGD